MKQGKSGWAWCPERGASVFSTSSTSRLGGDVPSGKYGCEEEQAGFVIYVRTPGECAKK